MDPTPHHLEQHMQSGCRKLRVGAYQFAGCGDPFANAAAVVRGIKLAARHGVQLLATQECALCGYPPKEVASSRAIDRVALLQALRLVVRAAKQYEVHVLLGTATFRRGEVLNSVSLVAPDSVLGRSYHKRALYGWDAENFVAGHSACGVYHVLGVKVGVRICYEVRFPEYFRELFRRGVDLAVVALADGGHPRTKFGVMRAHLISRAAENATFVLSANSVSTPQSAPTCLVDPDGKVICTAPRDCEALIHHEVVLAPPSFSRTGRIAHSRRLGAS